MPCGVSVLESSVKSKKVEGLLSSEWAVGLKPRTLSPSSVRVPVLSNTKVSIYPAMFIRGGDMQKMFFFLRRLIAKTIPQDMAQGSAAGTAIVSVSRAKMITSTNEMPMLI